jgi:ATP-binding cassette subfamily G (WHITE) protein 2 (SNQ2)
MLLVLGRPGGGCSTLLKNLAGFHEGYVRYEGDIKYNGVDIKIIKNRFRADVVYNAEGLHYPKYAADQY